MAQFWYLRSQVASLLAAPTSSPPARTVPFTCGTPTTALSSTSTTNLWGSSPQLRPWLSTGSEKLMSCYNRMLILYTLFLLVHFLLYLNNILLVIFANSFLFVRYCSIDYHPFDHIIAFAGLYTKSLSNANNNNSSSSKNVNEKIKVGKFNKFVKSVDWLYNESKWLNTVWIKL